MSLLEVLLFGIAALVVGMTVHGTISTAGHETMSSADYMLAEVVCERYVQAALAMPLDSVVPALPITKDLAGVPPGDEGFAAEFPEYERRLAGFKGKLSITQVEDGLYAIEVTMEWAVKPTSPVKRTYSLLRYRTAWDRSVRSSGKLTAAPQAQLSRAEQEVDAQ